MTDSDIERINRFIEIVSSSGKKYGEIVLIICDDKVKHIDCKIPLEILEKANNESIIDV